MMNPMTYKAISLLAAGLVAFGSLGAQASAKEYKQYDSYWWGVTSHKLSAEDRDLIERVVAAEARGESYECMVGVAQTIRERAEHWGLTAREVVTAKSQYAKPYKGKISDEIKDAVSAVFDDGARQFPEYTTHFHADYVDPYWNKYKIKRGVIDTTIFWGVEVK